MAKFERGDVARVKDRLNIVDVVGRYVQLRPAGAGRLTAPCPFHQETKPSFSVNEDKGFYHCFGCGASGDVIDFYCRINGLEFREGLEQLAESVGVELTRSRPDPEAKRRRQGRRDSMTAHAMAQEYFRANLETPEGAVARDYITRRGLSPEVVEAFGLGYSRDDWHGLENFLRARSISRDRGVAAGLLVKNEKGNIYDRFRGRLMFPIQNMAGQAIAFGARTLTGEDAKYLNSSESDIYVKGDNLYGLHQARREMARTRTALLTEGYTDVLSLHQFGFISACGVLGTALTEHQVRRLSGFCSKVALVFDGDPAGRKATLRAAEMVLVRGLSCRVVELPDGEDVDSLLQTQGAEAFQEFLDRAVDGLDFCLRSVSATCSPKEVVDWAGGFLDGLDRPDLAAFFIPRLASGLGLAEAELRRKAVGRTGSRAAGQGGQLRARGSGTQDGGGVAPKLKKTPRDIFDRWVLRFVTRNPQYLQDLADKGARDVLASDRARLLWDLLAEYDRDEIMPALDEQQKRFYVQCQLDQADDETVVRSQWQEICSGIENRQTGMLGGNLKDALKKAQQSGDQAETLRLLKLRQEIAGREDEQY